MICFVFLGEFFLNVSLFNALSYAHAKDEVKQAQSPKRQLEVEAQQAPRLLVGYINATRHFVRKGVKRNLPY